MSGYNPVSPFGSVFEGLTKGLMARDEMDRQKAADARQQRLLDLQVENNKLDNARADKQLQYNIMSGLQSGITDEASRQAAFRTAQQFGVQFPTAPVVKKEPGTGAFSPIKPDFSPVMAPVNTFTLPGLTPAQKATIAQQKASDAWEKEKLRQTLANALEIARINREAAVSSRQDKLNTAEQAQKSKRLADYWARRQVFELNLVKFADQPATLAGIKQGLAQLDRDYEDVLQNANAQATAADPWAQLIEALTKK